VRIIFLNAAFQKAAGGGAGALPSFHKTLRRKRRSQVGELIFR